MKKFRMFLIVYFLLFNLFSFAQNENELSRHRHVNEFVQELLSKKIDTFCDYEVFTEKTEAMYTQYLFWNDQGKTKVKKLELNHNYSVIEINADEIWQYLLTNREKIKTEDVKFFSILKNGQIQDVISQGNYFREFNLLVNSEVIKFWTSSFDFQKNDRLDGKKVENVYFEHNNNLKGKFALDQLENFLKKLERQKAFKD